MFDVEQMLAEYHSLAINVENNLKSMLSLVTEGRVPSQESISTLNIALDDLSKKYMSIKDIADGIDADQATKIVDGTVFEYAQLIEKCHNLQIKERLAEIEAQMRRFISVKSLVEKYGNALLPFQKEAENLLKELGQISTGDIPETILQVAANQTLFLHAVERDDFDDTEDEELLDSLDDIFTPVITRGLIRKKYYISEEHVSSVSTAETELEDCCSHIGGVSSVNTGDVISPAVDRPEIVAEKPTEDETEIFEQPTADNGHAVDGITAENPEKNNVAAVMVTATNRIKEKPANASAFKNEIGKLGKAAYSILPLFTNLGALLDAQVFAFGRYLECFKPNETKAVELTLSQLAAKNILAEYDFQSSGNKVYCLTTYGFSCMQKNSIASSKTMWGLSLGKVKLCGKTEMEFEPLELAVSNNADLLVYLAWCKNNYEAQVFRKIRSAILWRDTYYEVALNWNEDTYTCVLQHSFDNLLEGKSYIVIMDEDETIPTGMVCPNDCVVFYLKSNTMSMWSSEYVPTFDEKLPQGEVNIENPIGCVERALPEDADVKGSHPLEKVKPVKADSATHATIEGDFEIEDIPLPQTKMIFSLSEVSEHGFIDTLSSVEFAQKLLDNGITPDHYYIFTVLIDRLIQENKSYRQDDMVEDSLAKAIVLAKALSLYDEAYSAYYHQLLMAIDSPIQAHQYNGDIIFSLFESYEPGFEPRPVLKLMTLLRAMFAPEAAYDYALTSYAKSMFESYDIEFEGLDALKQLYNLFLKISEYSPNGFSVPVLRNFSNKTAEQNLLKQIRNNAHQAIAEPIVKSGLKCMTPMLRNCFGTNSSLRYCMEIIASDRREDREYVEVIYSDYCITSDGKTVISADKIDAFFAEQWKNAIDEIHGPRDLNAAQKAKVIEHVRKRLVLMERWLQITDSTSGDSVSSGKLMSLRRDILQEIKHLLPVVKSNYASYECAIIQTALKRISEKLAGQLLERTDEFVEFLRTGVFCVDEDYIPFVDDLFSSYRYYEPWRNALRHVATPVVGLKHVLQQISNPENSELYDNVGQAISICQYLDDVNINERQYSEDVDSARAAAKNEVKQFRDELELAFAYGRISEAEKEDISEGIELAYEKFDEFKNYGCLRTFLDALRRVMNDTAAAIFDGLKQDIEERLKTTTSEKLREVLENALTKLNEPERNFVVAEEYINRYDAGNSDDMELAESVDNNAFLRFVNSAFDELYDYCQKNYNGALRGFGCDYIEGKLRKQKVSAQYVDSSRALLRSMPNRPEEAKPNNILNMLRELGFDATGARVVHSTAVGSSFVHLSVDVNPDAKDKAEYAHPVDIMGTKLKSPVDVICLFGRMQANDIVNKVCSLELKRTAIVFLNGALDIQSRRQIAERFHREKSGQNPFLLVDWVLLLHLALHQKTERLPVLLSCSLPYTSSFQPFVLNGSVPDEMFIGRKKELNQILDPNGPVIVYGGRQLGKTALLERALSRASHPQNKEYAILVRAVGFDTEEMLVSEIVRELNLAGIPISNVHSTRELCQELRISYNAKQWAKLLVLIDESDAMLAAFSKSNPAYKPVFAFANLVRETGKDFKFVFAGLHNVCRAATDPNSVFGQFGEPLCIKPLRASDAHELLAKPLRYMGFAIDAAHLEHILVNTSFYPGIVHYVGYSLVENLSTRYADYYQASRGNPPYDLTDRQLGAIMSGDALNEKINERIRWTLQVDSRYFMLARCVTYLYYDNPEDNKTGHSVDSICEYAYLLEISCLEELNRQEYVSLLNEMVEMGILVMPSVDHYRLRQRRFMEAIGSSREKIESDIRIAEGERNA